MERPVQPVLTAFIPADGLWSKIEYKNTLQQIGKGGEAVVSMYVC